MGKSSRTTQNAGTKNIQFQIEGTYFYKLDVEAFKSQLFIFRFPCQPQNVKSSNLVLLQNDKGEGVGGRGYNLFKVFYKLCSDFKF